MCEQLATTLDDERASSRDVVQEITRGAFRHILQLLTEIRLTTRNPHTEARFLQRSNEICISAVIDGLLVIQLRSPGVNTLYAQKNIGNQGREIG
jgi:hypothetical protein